MEGAPSELPPLREVNHKIPLVDEEVNYRYHLPRCPDSLKPELMAKIKRYTEAGWWEPATVSQAAPLLCIPKKTGKLCTVVDGRKRNDNTHKDVTPFPDQDQIRMDVARGKYCSKINLSDAYEQVRVEPSEVWKTAFATVYGTFQSNVMQQGDCNAPATFQRLMNTIFRDYIGIFLHIYLDDMFVYSETIADHEEHLRLTFEKLQHAHLFLMKDKCELYAKEIDCLGHMIDDQGLHADVDKMAQIRNWRTPRSSDEIARFNGLAQYLAQFMPNLSSYTGPLSSITRGGRGFNWRPIHSRCFEMIKAMACKYPILRPVDPRNTDETIWVVCDGSVSGIGAMYGQGKDWQTCRPAGFMSKKFTAAQQHY